MGQHQGEKIQIGALTFLLMLAFPILLIAYTNCAPFSADQGSETSLGSLEEKRCLSAPAELRSPKSIEAVVALINSLPKPVDVPCLIESLERPLNIYAAESIGSAQPSEGKRSPRIFIFIDKLILTIVPDGPGRELLEMSVLVGEQDSIKAELELPIVGPIEASAPFNRVRNQAGSGTSCGLCHRPESVATQVTVAQAFLSKAIRPSPFSEVNLNALFDEYKQCNFATEAKRCAILRAVFTNGQVRRKDFPEGLSLF